MQGTSMLAPASFWDKAAGKYAKRPIKDLASYERTMARTRSYLAAADTVLEIGCGTGSTALLLSDCVRQIAATDISASMIAIAKQKVDDQGIGNVSFTQAGLEDLQAGADRFDAVMAFNLLHLVRDTAAAVDHVKGVLKPGGLFISKTPCLGETTGLLRIPIGIMQLFKRAPYVKFVKIDQLEKAIAVTGFEILETGNYPAAPPCRFIVARKI